MSTIFNTVKTRKEVNSEIKQSAGNPVLYQAISLFAIYIMIIEDIRN